MNNLLPIRLIAAGALVAALAGCSPRQHSEEPGTAIVQLAPSGPEDLGPASGLSTPPPDAAVFDLKYRPQTGAASEISYRSYWGFGGSPEEAQKNPFLQQVRKKDSKVHNLNNPMLKGREWSAVAHQGSHATTFYFDLNADGNLSENECLPATLKTGQGFEFITPDFMHGSQDASEAALTRVLFRIDFYGGDDPNCMWSPAALMEGTATLNQQPARLLLYANRPGGSFQQFGSSSYSIFDGKRQFDRSEYVPRQVLSSLICEKGEYYRLTVEGRRTNGLPARVVLVKDTSPTGTLSVKMAGSNVFAGNFTSLSLRGDEPSTVFLNLDSPGEKLNVPIGTYVLSRGTASYGGAAGRDWQVSFTDGPHATLKAGETTEVAMGQPTLTVRAVDEKHRYASDTPTASTFKRGTKIYLEPKMLGKSKEVFSRFRQQVPTNSELQDRPPTITITAQNGKRVLSKTMEYG
jgi:hypothetical protein